MHHPWLGTLPQSGCTGAWVLVIGSSGGGGRRRRRRSPPHHGSHRPHWRASDTPDGEDLHRSTGPTLRTAGVTDHHHAANLVDTVSSHASTIGASIDQSRPVGPQYVARSVESMRQPCAPMVHPLHRPNQQRPRARVLGLDDRS
jgi:hypothetical protein